MIGAQQIVRVWRFEAVGDVHALNAVGRPDKGEERGCHGIQGLAELGPAVSELRDTLAALRGISRRLEENPANYLLGREKTKEFPP